MITYQLGEETRQAKSGWHEVTLNEFIQLEGLTLEERAASLCGLTVEEAQQAAGIGPIWLHSLELASSEPESEALEINFGQEPVGKIELCLKFLKAAGDNVQYAYTYLYAVYAYEGEYHLLDCFVNAFPKQLVERAGELPITKTYGVVMQVLAGVIQVKSRELYQEILSKEPDIKQVNAGVKRFDKYGFFAILSGVAGGDITRLESLLNTPADVFYTWLCLETERDEYQEDLLSQSQPNAIR